MLPSDLSFYKAPSKTSATSLTNSKNSTIQRPSSASVDAVNKIIREFQDCLKNSYDLLNEYYNFINKSEHLSAEHLSAETIGKFNNEFTKPEFKKATALINHYSLDKLLKNIFILDTKYLPNIRFYKESFSIKNQKKNQLIDCAKKVATLTTAPDRKKLLSGVSILTKNGEIYSGAYYEEGYLAVSALQSALLALFGDRKCASDIQHIVQAIYSETEKSDFSQEISYWIQPDPSLFTCLYYSKNELESLQKTNS